MGKKQMKVLKILYDLEEPISIVGRKVWGVYELCEKDRRDDYMDLVESHIDDDELLLRIYQRNQVNNWWHTSTSDVRGMINNLFIAGLVEYVGEHKCRISESGRHIVKLKTRIPSLRGE